MNEQIRRAIEEQLQARNLSQSELATRMGISRHALNRTLRNPAQGGKVPRLWQLLLDELGLELVVRPRGEVA